MMPRRVISATQRLWQVISIYLLAGVSLTQAGCNLLGPDNEEFVVRVDSIVAPAAVDSSRVAAARSVA
jgi:hypothetical protein